MKSESAATVAQNPRTQTPSAQLSPQSLSRYHEIIDARTPAEYAEDHVPGAINLPVLDDEERVRIGTLHKQASAFEAKKVGAALVSRHIADYLQGHFADLPMTYKPLIYCWRGGNRSGSLTHVLQRVGFKAEQLDGGYKAYRRLVINELETLPAQFHFVVICGSTGSGKSRLLQALQSLGAQVLDLEMLAAHRGSLLGNLPGQSQPSQKKLESLIWWALRHFDPKRPVFVESESKKIGNLRVSDALLARIRAATAIWLETSLPLRVQLLLEDYAHFLAQPAQLLEKVSHLTALRGHATIARWQSLIHAGDWRGFVQDLLENHYDPAYQKSLSRNYHEAGKGNASQILRLTGIQQDRFTELARQILLQNVGYDDAGSSGQRPSSL